MGYFTVRQIMLFRKRTVYDEEFGELRRSGRSWTGTLEFNDIAGDIGIILDCEDPGSLYEEKLVIDYLRSNYDQILEELTTPLYEAYQEVVACDIESNRHEPGSDPSFSAPRREEEIWNVCKLFRIDFHVGSKFWRSDYSLAYDVRWESDHNDHYFLVHFKDRVVIGIDMDG